jgi:hypothetical protein
LHGRAAYFLELQSLGVSHNEERTFYVFRDGNFVVEVSLGNKEEQEYKLFKFETISGVKIDAAGPELEGLEFGTLDYETFVNENNECVCCCFPLEGC